MRCLTLECLLVMFDACDLSTFATGIFMSDNFLRLHWVKNGPILASTGAKPRICSWILISLEPLITNLANCKIAVNTNKVLIVYYDIRLGYSLQLCFVYYILMTPERMEINLLNVFSQDSIGLICRLLSCHVEMKSSLLSYVSQHCKRGETSSQSNKENVVNAQPTPSSIPVTTPAKPAITWTPLPSLLLQTLKKCLYLVLVRWDNHLVHNF